MNLVVIGGVAGGMSFAARARRLDEHAHIIVFEKDEHVSFANCGLPYYVGGEITNRDALLLHTPESLKNALNLDVRTFHEVKEIRPAQRVVVVRDVRTNAEYEQTYDELILATGAAPFVPPIPGADAPNVFTLRNVDDVDRIKNATDALVTAADVTAAATSSAKKIVPRAVVVGAGFIGLEMAEAFRHRGLDVTVVELADQVLAPFDKEMTTYILDELARHEVQVLTSSSLQSITHTASGLELQIQTQTQTQTPSETQALPADIVLLGIGVRPSSGLAVQAGLATNARGALQVDEHLRTSDEHIYAIGDAIEVIDAVTDAPTMVPLAGLANRQGRAVADHLFGRNGKAPRALGTAIVRVFERVAATTGKSEKALRAANIAHHVIYLHPNNHAGYFPGAEQLHMKVTLRTGDGQVLGAQIVGGEGVDKRIDVLATAIAAGMTVDQLAELELSYAPPFGSAKDPVNMAGFIGQNLLRSDVVFWRLDKDTHAATVTTGATDTTDTTDTATDPEVTLLDVRTEREFAQGHLENAINIPHTELRQRLSEVPSGKSVRVYCASGFRSYLAARILMQSGYSQVATLNGGLLSYA